MNTKDIKISWTERKKKLRQKLAFLTDNNLVFEEGTKEKMLIKLQNELGISREELIRIITEF